MLVYLRHILIDAIPKHNKKGVAQLVRQVSKVKVEFVAQGRLLILLGQSVRYDLVPSENGEAYDCQVHDYAHSLARQFTFLDKVGSFLRIKVANLEEDHWLYELLNDNECIVELALEEKSVPDGNNQLEDAETYKDRRLHFAKDFSTGASQSIRPEV